MAKKILIMVLVFAMIAMAFVACQTSAPAGTDDAVADDAGADDAGADDAEEEPVVITMNHMYVDSFTNIDGIAFNELVERFQEENNVIIEVESVGHDIYMTKIQAAGASEELPTIFTALPSLQQAFSEAGLIHELGAILEEDPEWRDSFLPGVFSDHTSNDGSIWAMPYISLLSHVVYYNEEILEECGITSFPETLEDFKAMIPKIIEKGYVPVACGNKGKAYLPACIQVGLVYRFIDPEWYKSLRTGTGAKFTDPEYIEAIDTLRELIDIGMFNEDLNSIDQPQAKAQYYGEGKAAMFISGSWEVSSFVTDIPREVLDATEYAMIPAPADSPENSNYCPGGTGWGWCISSSAEGKELEYAIKFLKEMSGLQVQTQIINNGGEVIIDVSPTDPGALDPFVLKYLDFKSSVELVGNPEIQLSPLYVDASYTGYQSFSAGTIDSAEMAQMLQDAIEK